MANIAENPKRETIVPSRPMYWVKLSRVTLDDVNALLDVYQKVSGKLSNQMTKEDFEKLRKEFKGEIGMAEWQIGENAALEWRRRLSREGNFYVRFKIKEKGISGEGPRGIDMQRGIDRYFIEKEKAVPLGMII